jgi:outer membrane autotransporter protein
MLRPKLVIRQRTVAAIAAPLALVLSMSISHQAMAACSGLPTTAGNDTLICDDANGAINALGGNDKVTINDGATITGTTTGDIGNDLIVMNGGTAGNLVGGNAVGSAADTDRIFIFGGDLPNAEVQTGAGVSPFVFFMGGTLTDGSIEVRRGSQNAVVVFDGGTLEGELEFQGASGPQGIPVNPTIYFRSGTFTGELEDGADNGTFTFDPINSKDAATFQTLANAAANGGDASLSTSALNTLIGSGPGGAPANPDAAHVMIINAPEIEMGAGNDTVNFIGAVNVGDDHNLELNGDNGEASEFDGGDGIDTMNVAGGSFMELGEVELFEKLNVLGGSTLVLEEEEYEFGDSGMSPADAGIHVDGSSVLWFTGAEEVETPHIQIDGPNGAAAPLKVSEQYAAFDPGGILMFGAMPAGGGDDDDDEEAGGPVNVELEIGPNTIVNGGTMGTLNGIAGDKVTVVGGGYLSNNGNLVIDTQLGGSNSITDRFDFDPTQAVDGLTTIYVNNAGGTGAITGHGANDGIVVVTGPDGFGPTGAFQLGVNLTGRREVLAGAFSYQAVTSGTTVRLQSDILDQVPAYATASSATQRFSSTGLGTLYKRLGEVRLGLANDRTFAGGAGSMWARGLYGDYDVDPSVGYGFSQKSDGVLMGVDGTVGTEGGGRMIFGVFGGYGSSDIDVAATIWGQNSTSKIDLSGWSVGGYGTYWENGRPGTGYYFDGVVKADILDYDMTSAGRSTSASTDGYAATISGETGYGFGLGGNLSLQPQAQLSYTTVSISNYTDSYNLSVGNGTAESLVGRASLQLQGNYGSVNSGVFAPYVIASVLSEFLGDNETVIAGTPFQSDMGLTWFEAGGGVTAELSKSISLYGSAEYSFGDVEGWGGTGGVKARW